jgi:FAD synthetase
MIEDAQERASKYLDTTTESLKRLKPNELPVRVSQEKFNLVLELAQGYVKDAGHYLTKKRPVTSLACVAYAEGLLDALKFLELADL